MRQHASDGSERIEVGGSSLEVSIDSDQFELGRTVLPDWVTQSARAVADYFGQFPVPRARARITVSQMNHFVSELPVLAQIGQCRVLALWAQLGVRHNEQGLRWTIMHLGQQSAPAFVAPLAGRLRI